MELLTSVCSQKIMVWNPICPVIDFTFEQSIASDNSSTKALALILKHNLGEEGIAPDSATGIRAALPPTVH